MGMKETDILKAAKMLLKAEKSRRCIRPISDYFADVSLQDAYAIQSLVVDHKRDNNEKVTGRKIGLTSLAMQELLGVNEPDYGILTDGMTVKHNKVERNRFIQPKIEAEFAFVLKKDLYGPNVSANDVVDATEFVAMAFEIVDSRICDWKIGLTDTIADNGSSAMYLLGSDMIQLQQIDLCSVCVKLYKNEIFQNEGMGRDVMGNPANAVAWLANTLSMHHEHLKKGEVILSGAVSAALTAESGDCFSAEFEGIGRLDIYFI